MAIQRELLIAEGIRGWGRAAWPCGAISGAAMTHSPTMTRCGRIADAFAAALQPEAAGLDSRRVAWRGFWP